MTPRSPLLTGVPALMVTPEEKGQAQVPPQERHQDFYQACDKAAAVFAARVPRPGALAGLDVGRRRIGLAVSDPNQQVAVSGLTCPRTSDHQRLLEALMIRKVVGLVIGWPLHMTGRNSSRCQSVRRLVGDLKSRHPLPIFLWDERLTSQGASRLGRDPNDAQVAAVILQSALDRLGGLAAADEACFGQEKRLMGGSATP